MSKINNQASLSEREQNFERKVKFQSLNLGGIIISAIAINMFSFGAQAENTPQMPAPFEKTTKQLKASITTFKPQIKEDGISIGDKKLVFAKKFRGTVGQSAIKLIADDHDLAALSCYFSTGVPKGRGMSFPSKKGSYEFLKKKSEYVWCSKFPMDDNGKTAYGTYKQTAEVLPDGRIKFTVTADKCPNPKYNKFGTRMFMIHIPYIYCSNKQIIINGKPIRLPDINKEYENPPRIFEDMNTYASKITFTPDNLETEFSLELPDNNVVWVRALIQKSSLRKRLQIRIFPQSKKGALARISFILDIRKGLKSAAKSADDSNINFWKSDRLKVPDYKACKNLLQNPSFESGLRYWTFDPCWGKYSKVDGDDIYTVDNLESKFGNSSLRIRTFGDLAPFSFLQSFVVPVVPGEKYTFSFYAKTDKPDETFIDCIRAITAKWKEFPRLGQSPRLTGDWKRYSFSFVAPNNAVSVLFRAINRGKGEAKVWMDGLQLEKGGSASGYAEAPLFAELTTDRTDNFFNAGEKINAKLKIVGPPGEKGTVDVKLTNFYYQQLWRKKFTFTTDKHGKAEIKLPVDDKIKLGLFIIKTDFKLANGASVNDYFRLARMKFLHNTHRNKNIFGNNFMLCKPNSIKLLNRCRKAGFGSVSSNLPYPQEHTAMFSKYGIDFMGASMAGYGIRVGNKVILERLRERVISVDTALEKKVEDAAFKKAESMPWVNTWALDGECSSYTLLQKNKYNDFAKLLIAFYRGVKKFDPNKKVMVTQGPCNMMPQSGTRQVDETLKALKRVAPDIKFDINAIHPYRTTPEEPDLDSDTAVFLNMLERNDYGDKPVYWMEGIYHIPYIIPEWGLNAHRGCSSDHYRAGCPTYHMGWGERIAAAYYARSWLVALKYQKRIKHYNGWGSWMSMDTALTPLAVQFVPNVLGNLFGDADFLEDIRISNKIRCYVFKDKERCPVAALWSYYPTVDRGLEPAPMLKINLGGENPEFIDFMGNVFNPQKDADGNYLLQAGSYPVFIKGKPGSGKTFCKSIRETVEIMGKKPSPLVLVPKLANKNTLIIRARNTTGKNFAGSVVCPQLKLNRSLKVARGNKAELRLRLKPAVSAEKVTDYTMPIVIKDSSGTEYKQTLSFSAFAVKKAARKIKIDGNLSDWKHIPEIKMVHNNVHKPKHAKDAEKVGYSGDLEASYRMAWDNENFYFYVRVIDDKFIHQEKSIPARWDNDCVQLYFDTLCTARLRDTKGFYGYEYNYDLFPDVKNNKLIVYRRFAPEQQAAGGLFAPKPNTVDKDAQSYFKRLPGNTCIYEVAIPKKNLAPMRLVSGYIAGIAFNVTDRDTTTVRKGVGEATIKNALTTTPQGTQPYNKPHLFPIAILED